MNREKKNGSYSKLFDREITGVYQKGVATKIQQFMQSLRNHNTPENARRWVMELIQNARDVSYPKKGIDIQIELDEGNHILRFYHNGRPFRGKDILALVNQVSGKTQDDKDTVGQFGTGFMSTYMLSEHVGLESVLEDEDVDENGQAEKLPPRRFSIDIDRSGDSSEEILSRISENISALKRVDEDEGDEGYDPSAFNTCFTYYLDTAAGREAATAGVRDLSANILYIFLFSKKLNSLTVITEDGSGRRETHYTRKNHRKKAEEQTGLKTLEVDIEQDGKHVKKTLCYLVDSEEEITLAAEYDEEGFLPANEITSRVFIDFPLIGTEAFPFPVVIGSRLFFPNEPRSGISLVDHENARDAAINKRVIDRAVALYGEFLQKVIAEGIGHIEHIIAIPSMTEDPERSSEWVKEHIYDVLFEKIKDQEIINTNQGKTAFSNERLRFCGTMEPTEKEALQRVVEPLDHIFLPEDGVDWWSIFQNYPAADGKKLMPAEIAEHSIDICKSGHITGISHLEWFRRLYALCLCDDELSVRMRLGELSVFLSQEDGNGTRYFRTFKDAYQDPGIPFVFKEICERFDQDLSENEKFHLIGHLLPKEFGEVPELSVYSVDSVIEHIKNRTYYRSNTQYCQSKAYLAGQKLMLACGPNGAAYRIGRIILSEVPERSLAWRTKETVDEVEAALTGQTEEGQGAADAGTTGEEEVRSTAGAGTTGEEEGQGAADAGTTGEPVLTAAYPDEMWSYTYFWLSKKLTEVYNRYGSVKALAEAYKLDEKETLNFINESIPLILNKLSWGVCEKLRMLPAQSGELINSNKACVDRITDKSLKEIGEVLCTGHGEGRLSDRLMNQAITCHIPSIREYTDRSLAKEINSVLQEAEGHGGISGQPDAFQDACSRLLSWIRSNPERAEEYFPSYATESGQARLLTVRQTVELQRQANKYKELEEAMGEYDLEEYLQLCAARKNTFHYVPEYDVFLGDCGDFNTEEEWMEYGRLVGETGEKAAFESLIQEYESNDWEIKERQGWSFCELSRPWGTVQILRPDTDTYKQSGWDIKIIEHDRNGQGKDEVREQYIEVKTNVNYKASRDKMRISRSQFACCLKYGKEYSIWKMTFDTKTNTASLLLQIEDVAGKLCSGQLILNQKTVEFVRDNAA